MVPNLSSEVWVYSTCMPAEVQTSIKRWARRLKPGARVLTTTSSFGEGLEGFEPIDLGGSWGLPVVMSAGEPDVYAWRRS